MNRFLSAVLFAAIAASPASAQGGSKGVVSVTATGPTDSVAAGYSFQVAVVLQVKAGYHINAQKPSEDYLIGTRLNLAPPDGMKISKVSYPRAKMATFGFSEEPLAVYDGAVELVATIKTDDSLEPGERSITGKVTFQACNDQACLAPSTVDVTATVQIAPAEEKNVGVVTLAGAPPGARVSIDGKPAGRADGDGRFVARKVEEGRRRVRVEADGFAPFEETITVDGGRSQTVSVSMSATDAATPTDEGASPETAAAHTGQPPAVAPPTQPPAPAPSESTSIPTAYLGVIGAVVGAGVMAVLLLARRRSTTRPAP